MKFSYDFSIENELHFEMHKCFAYEGMIRIGVLDDYICGIHDRIEGWIEGLGIKYEVSPQIDGCLMNEGIFLNHHRQCNQQLSMLHIMVVDSLL